MSVYHGVTVEDDVFLGPHMTFTNDLCPRARNTEWKVVETFVRKGTSIGAHATIICGVTLGEHSMIGAGSVVTRDVPPHGLVFGNPARLRGFVCGCGSKLTLLDVSDDYARYVCEPCNREIRIPLEDHVKVKT